MSTNTAADRGFEMAGENGGMPDVNEVIRILTEHPQLLSQISSLLRSQTQDPAPHGESGQREEATAEVSAMPETGERVSETAQEIPASAAPARRRHTAKERKTLLCAMQPYVSEKRAQSISSLLSVVDILDVLQGR